MNCTVCGNPLLYDRVAFHCSCDAFIHAYCWDQHVLQAHRPSYEVGAVNLDGEFTARESRPEAQLLETRRADERIAEQEAAEERAAMKQLSGSRARRVAAPQLQAHEDVETEVGRAEDGVAGQEAHEEAVPETGDAEDQPSEEESTKDELPAPQAGEEQTGTSEPRGPEEPVTEEERQAD